MPDHDLKNVIVDGKRDKYARLLIWAGFLVYMLMLGSKNVYSAELVTLMEVFDTTKAQTSLAMTYYFIVYAICQIVLSFIMSKLNLRIFLSLSGGLSALSVILIGLSKSINSIYYICALNGVFSAGIYAGCMATFSKYVPAKMLPFANKIMTLGSAFYAVLCYGVPPIFVDHGLWNMPFIVLGSLFLLSVVFFFVVFTKLKDYPTEMQVKTVDKEKPLLNLASKKFKFIYFAICIITAVVNNGMYYCVFNYIPNLFKEAFSMPDSYSILITLVVPLIASMFSVYVISLSYKFTNMFKVAFLVMFVGMLALLSVVFVFDYNIILTLALFVVFVACRTGTNSVFTGVLAFKMRNQINSGSFLAIINAIAALMAGVVPTIIGSVIDSYSGLTGYGVSYLIALVGCFIFMLIILGFIFWFNKSSKLQNEV